MIHGFIEVDVTRPRQYLRDHQARTGELLSFTAFLIACLGRALEHHPSVHAYRGWGQRVYCFEEVDVHLAFAAQAGQACHVAHILRAVNHKSVRQLHDEIRAFQTHQRDAIEAQQMRRLASLPGILRRLVYWVVRPGLLLGRRGKSASRICEGKGLDFLLRPLACLQYTPHGSTCRKPGCLSAEKEPKGARNHLLHE
jgi:hypothetical protein